MCFLSVHHKQISVYEYTHGQLYSVLKWLSFAVEIIYTATQIFRSPATENSVGKLVMKSIYSASK